MLRVLDMELKYDASDIRNLCQDIPIVEVIEENELDHTLASL